MSLVVYFIPLLLFCHQTAVVSQLTSSPDDPTIANETSVLTLMWKYNAVGSILLATFGGNGNRIARRVGANDIMVEAKYQDRFRANISDSQAWLEILRVQRSDEGTYDFRLEPTAGNTISGQLELIVHFSPTLFNNVSGDHSVKERSDLNLYCGASGKPVPSITWTRVFENGSESQVLHTGTSWKIASINQTDAGKYRCTAYNGIGSPVSHTITVKVLFPPKLIHSDQEYKVAVQQSVTLRCQAEGYPDPTFSWRPCKDSCNTATLTVPEVLNDTTYTCTATNSEGSDSADASVVIAGNKINVTMTIKDDKECFDAEGQYNKSSLSRELSVTMRGVFANESSYLRTTLNDVRCGSVIVYLTLSFNTTVTEKRILNILKDAAKEGKLGDFNVDASSIKGTRPEIPVTSPPGIGKTTPKPSDDDYVTIIIAVVVSVAVLAIIVGAAVFCVYKKKKDKKNDNKEVGDENKGGQQMNQIQGGHGNNGYNNTHSSSASSEKTADITYAVVEQGNSMPRTAPKKPLRTYETEILVEGNGSGYEVAGSSSRRPEEPPGKKPKKQKKGQEPDKPVGVVYAQVDKSKPKSKASQNTYDQSERPKSKQPGELTYAELDHGQGSSMPRNSAAPTKKPQPYVETEYAMIV